MAKSTESSSTALHALQLVKLLPSFIFLFVPWKMKPAVVVLKSVQGCHTHAHLCKCDMSASGIRTDGQYSQPRQLLFEKLLLVSLLFSGSSLVLVLGDTRNLYIKAPLFDI